MPFNAGATEERKKLREKERGGGEKERASMRNDVWNTSEMLSILGGCPSLNPSLLQSLGFSQQVTNAKAHTNARTQCRRKKPSKSKNTRHPTVI